MRTILLGLGLFTCAASLHAATPPVKSQPLTSPDQVPEGLAKSDWHSIRAAYDAGRHAIHAVDGSWQARNPGQQWTTKFDGRGFIAQPKDADWQWGFEFKSYGFGDRQTEVGGSPAVRSEGQRLSYQWTDTVQEWFVNDTRGLEHGFTITQRPATDEGASSGGTPLSFTLATRGTLRPSVSSDALTVHFRDDSNAPVLTYSGLKVWDADGKILASRFEAAGDNQVRLLVEENGARYPLTIDPIAQQAYLKAGNNGPPTTDYFGRSVSVSGDTVVVGAPNEDGGTTGVNSTPNNNASDSGAAYVFVRSGTTWSQQAYLKASNTGAGDLFGSSVSVSANTVVVGAPQEDSSTTGVSSTPNETAANSGAAYVFTRSGTTWTQQAYLKASNTGASDNFGNSVAVSVDTVVVGAPQEDSSTMGVNSAPNESAIDSGATYVFLRIGTAWSQQAYLKASNTGASDAFGCSVSVSGNTLIVGAYLEDSSTLGVNSTSNDSSYDSGAAYVFARSGSAWSQQAYLKTSNTEVNDWFGWSVAISADTAVIGAINENSSTTGVNSTPDDSADSSGAAFVFTRSGTAWSQPAYLKPSNTSGYQQFGVSVAVADHTVVVGAYWEDSSTTGVNTTPDISAGDSGAAYVFTRSGTAWSQQAYLKASNTGALDRFGSSVAVSGDSVVVGAYFEDSSTTGVNSTPNESALDSGAAYVFTRIGTTWTQQAYLKASNAPSDPGAEDHFGCSVSVSGDTVVVGATGEDSSTMGVNSTPNENASSAGAAYVFVRSGTTWTQQAYLKASNTRKFTSFGNSVSVAGNTVVVGAYGEGSSTTGVNSTPDEIASASGAVYVFVRSGTTWSQQAYLKASNTGADDRFGGSVSVSGDTVVVGAPNEDSGTTGVNSSPNETASRSGAAYVFMRSGTVWSQQAYLKASNTGVNDDFGTSVAVSVDTVVVGASGEGSSTTGVNSAPNNSAVASGAAYVFSRSGTAWSQQAYLKASNTGAEDYFGQSVSVSGNTVVVGAFAEDSSTTGVNSTPNESAGLSGAAYVFTRSGTMWSQQAYIKASNTGLNDRFGFSVSVSDDTLIVGAFQEDSSSVGVNSTPNESAGDSGAAYVFTRSGTAWSQQAYLKSGNTGVSDGFGRSVAVSGDTVIVGNDHEDSSTTGVNSTPDESATDSGAAYIFTGLGPPPGVVSITPTIGSVSGGTTVTITGTGFTGASAVTIGGVPAASFTVNSNTSIIATTPAQAAGTVDVSVTTPLGTGTGVGLFSYVSNAPPIFTSLPFTMALTAGVAPSANLTASGNPAPSFSVQSGSLPPGLTLSSAGVLGGTPTMIGTYTGIFAATNSAGTATQAFSFTVNTGTQGAAELSVWTTSSGLTGAEGAPSATPFNDGIENLLKYAFNMNAGGPDVSVLTALGIAGLPLIALDESGAEPILRVVFLRRKGSGLIYAPQRSNTLGGFVAMTGAQTVTFIDAQWERVTVEEPVAAATSTSAFSRVQIILP